MKTKYQFIHFENSQECLFPGNKPMWNVKNNRSGGLLGMVGWYSAWKQYCFYPEPNTIFNDTCLADIQHFIGQLKDKP